MLSRLVSFLPIIAMLSATIGSPSRAAAQSDSGRTIEKSPSSDPRGGAPTGSRTDPADDERGGARLLPPDQRPGGGDWKLGVNADNLDTGVRVTTVVPNSAAQRAGIERNDVIVTVNGAQVGRIGKRTNELGAELQRQAGRDGRVLLLILNTRNSRLENIDVTLDRGGGGGGGSGDGVVTGTARLRLPLNLPPRSTLVVRLVQLGRDGRQTTVSERSYSNVKRLPQSFEVRYDARRIEPDRTYEIWAEVVADGKTQYDLERGVPVITRGNPTTADITLRKSR